LSLLEELCEVGLVLLDLLFVRVDLSGLEHVEVSVALTTFKLILLVLAKVVPL